MKCLLSTSVFVCLAFTIPGVTREKRANGDIKVSDQQVQKLFKTMRAGKYNSLDFPALKWENIPALLKMGTSKRVLKNFPRNPLSSQFEQECPEGMVALWLVEGIRQGCKGFHYPSLNALCLPAGGTPRKWTEVSAENHDRVLKLYQKWWKRAKSLSVKKAAAIDPLKETKLGWY